jgi:hypothetical protein
VSGTGRRGKTGSADGESGHTEQDGPDEQGGQRSGPNRRVVLGAAAAGVVGVVGGGFAIAENSGGHAGGGGTVSAAGQGSGPVHASASATGGGPVAEEDLPGDADWRITSAGKPEAIMGYADQYSVLPGGEFGLYVSTSAASYQVRAFRVGWYGGAEARLVWTSAAQPGHVQSEALFDNDTNRVHTQWTKSLTVSTENWPEGAYLLRLDAANGHQRYVPMIVRSTNAKGKLLLMHGVATWQAYNLWGGYNLYQGLNGSFDTRSLVVSFDRPYDDVGAEKFLVYERAAVVLAERLRLPVAYTTGMDVHADPTVLTGASAIFSLGHDEYWTPEQRKSVTAARDAGTNIAFLGANTCFRRIRFESSDLGAGRNVACYKSSYERDPLYGHQDALVTNDFRADPSPDPESSMTGVLYESYPTDAPYVVINADHWLYAGTGVKNGDGFAHLVGVEYDRVTPGEPTPRPIEIIAHSPLICNGQSSHSDSAYYTVPSGAGVFASGTMRWVEGLLAGTPEADNGLDAATGAFVTRTTSNLMRAFAAGPAGHTQPAPRDNVNEVYA